VQWLFRLTSDKANALRFGSAENRLWISVDRAADTTFVLSSLGKKVRFASEKIKPAFETFQRLCQQARVFY
jgi:light-regulated signal transduction histidine kinase (bacteriophytochrome)